MRPEARDAGLLWDMLEFSHDSLEYARTITYDELLTDKYARYTLAKTLELIGEAASRVSPAFRQAHPEIDWIPVIGFRHRLVHDYRNINFKIAWDIVNSEVPVLIKALTQLVPTPPGSGDAGHDDETT